MTNRRDVSETGQKESLIGICAAIGDDFGFNPDILRVALAVGLLFVPAIVVGAYLAMGLVVLASRLLFPPKRNRVIAAAAPVPSPAAAEEPARERMLEAA